MEQLPAPEKKPSLAVVGGVGALVFLLVGQSFAVSLVTDIITSVMIFGAGYVAGRFGQ